ncbi:alpha/beta hydrolase [Candidatus Thiodictyon syntrophicum]|jgi:pimeloyl-ACP methyl ester carboxylesterase|uniref:Alpha/beta hydrolase n=1 Tax=Candidatus Thiodictyon syntrophicum TaxID=1166950 RepID=A0A2K8UBP6_9GAMM|nr:alpha/beta fold hydrolase [Candidatus Thiodictyon syntrophicum]AUB82849.1 alpha/beta hydrolase [Candidatus Thiodictyon syntrophicum]
MLTIFSILIVMIVAAIPAGVHFGFRAPRIRETGSPADYGLAFEELRIPTVRGRHLFGWLLSAPQATCTIVVLHGWGSNAEMMLPLAAPLRRAGFNLLLCDARSHGRSDGDSFSSLPRFAEDLGMAIAWLKQQHPHLAARVAVLGHSVGAGAALLEASRNADIAAVISIAAFADPARVTAGYLRPLHVPRLFIRLVSRYVEWIIGYRFAAIAPMNTVRSVTCPLLLVHGTADQTVTVADAYLILANCGAPDARLLEITDAGHHSVEQIERHVGDLLGFLGEHCPARERPFAVSTSLS